MTARTDSLICMLDAKPPREAFPCRPGIDTFELPQFDSSSQFVVRDWSCNLFLLYIDNHPAVRLTDARLSPGDDPVVIPTQLLDMSLNDAAPSLAICFAIFQEIPGLYVGQVIVAGNHPATEQLRGIHIAAHGHCQTNHSCADKCCSRGRSARVQGVSHQSIFLASNVADNPRASRGEPLAQASGVTRRSASG